MSGFGRTVVPCWEDAFHVVWSVPLTDPNVAQVRSYTAFAVVYTLKRSSIFVPVVNPQTRQDLASVINSDPQREQNILLLTLHRTLRLRLRLQEGKRWETLRNASRQLVSDITLKIRKGSGN